MTMRTWLAARWPSWLGGRAGVHRTGKMLDLSDNTHQARARLDAEQVRLEREQLRTRAAARGAGKLPAAADRFTMLMDQALGGTRR